MFLWGMSKFLVISVKNDSSSFVFIQLGLATFFAEFRFSFLVVIVLIGLTIDLVSVLVCWLLESKFWCGLLGSVWLMNWLREFRNGFNWYWKSWYGVSKDAVSCCGRHPGGWTPLKFVMYLEKRMFRISEKGRNRWSSWSSKCKKWLKVIKSLVYTICFLLVSSVSKCINIALLCNTSIR